MKLKLKAFGIARDIIGESELSFEFEQGNTIDNLKNAIAKAYPEFEKLRSFAIAVNQEYQDDSFVITDNDEVVIIPPVSGG